MLLKTTLSTHQEMHADQFIKYAKNECFGFFLFYKKKQTCVFLLCMTRKLLKHVLPICYMHSPI